MNQFCESVFSPQTLRKDSGKPGSAEAWPVVQVGGQLRGSATFIYLLNA